MTATTMWDPYDVWQRLLHDHPVSVHDPGNSVGRMDAETASAFWMTVAEYPDPLQDTLYVIAHAQGFEAAIAALDDAIGRHLRANGAADAAGKPASGGDWPARIDPDASSRLRRLSVAL